MRKIVFIILLFICFKSGAQIIPITDSANLEAAINRMDSVKRFTHDINDSLKMLIKSLNRIPRSGTGGSGGIGTLNTLTASSQTFATGTSGTDFAISSSTSTHTFNIPDASATARGLVTTGTQTFAGSKTFSTNPTFSTIPANRIVTTTTGGATTYSNNFIWTESTQRLSMDGGTTANNAFSIAKTLGSIAQDFIVMTDNTSSKTIKIGDGSASGFSPYMQMVPDGTTQNQSFLIFNANSSGSTAAAVFRAQNLAGSGTLSTQPLFEFQNYTTRVLHIDANGNLVHANRHVKIQGADVASVAGAIALGNDGNTFEITGTNAITLISNVGWQNGAEITLIFTSTATLTDGTANSGTDIGMELAGNANFSATADDAVTLVLCEIGGTQRWREKSRSVN